MSKTSRILGLLVAISLALSFLVISPGPALAAAITAPAPATGPVGTMVSVSGSAFAASETGVVVTYDNVTVIPSITVSGAGAWGPVSFIVPDSASGTHIIDAHGNTTTAAAVPDQTFVVTPVISPSATSGPPGTSILVSGTGFAASETGVVVTYDGTVIISGFSVSAKGSWNAAFQTPASASGIHVIDARGNATAAASVPDVNFTISPLIVASPTTGAAGSVVSVTGTGFGTSETGITVIYDGTPVALNQSASATGSWTAAFNIPNSAAGTHIIDAYGATTLVTSVPDISFTVTAGISHNVTSGPVGTSIVVTGSGFSSSETGIVVTYSDAIIVSGITATTTGTWTATFNIPPSSSGAHAITAYGSLTTPGTIAPVNFTVTGGISSNRVSGNTGQPITITGSGFSTRETGITVTYDGNPVASGITASPTGSWSTTFNIPTSSSGRHSITAYGSSTTPGTITPLNFDISSTISLNKTTGPVGTSVTVTGSSFGASETGIAVTYDGNPIVTGITASNTGSWSTTFTIPPSASGAHPVTAYGTSTTAGTITAVSFNTNSTINVNKNGGTVGTSIAVTGSGFGASEVGITITFDGNPVASGISADANGSWSGAFNIPVSSSGTHAITAYGPSTQTSKVSAFSFTVSPTMSLSKTGGTTNTSVTVTGTGFGPSEKGITITYDNNPVALGISAGPTGSWSATFNIPASASGPHAVSAYGATTATGTVADSSFTVSASISSSNLTGITGANATITGSGYGAGETGITVTYDDKPVATGITASSTGSWSTMFTIPLSASGRHSISAHGSSTPAGTIAALIFSVSPGITIIPASGNVGIKIDVNGSGFAAGSSITVTYDGTQMPNVMAVSDASGNFSLSVTAPKSKGGLHTIKAIDTTKGEAQANFMMENTAPSVPLLISPRNSSRIGILGGITPTLTWSNVTDPSGVTYVLQIDISNQFLNPVLENNTLTTTSYTLTAEQALERGTYYWRVKAIDGASNESAWSQPWTFTAGRMALWTLIAIIVCGAGGIGVGTYLFLRRRRRMVAAPEYVEGEVVPFSSRIRVSRPEKEELAQAPNSTKLLPRASVSSSPPVEEMATEENIRAKMTVEFTRSLPLIQPGYNAHWLIELAQSAGISGNTFEIYRQLL